RRGGPVAGPAGAGRQGQARPPRLPAPGPPAPGRRAGGHPGAEPARGSGAGPVPHPGRHGRGPDPGPQPADQVLVASRAGVAGRVQLDASARGVAGHPMFDEAALATTFGHYRAVVLTRDAQLAAVEADLVPWFDREPFADGVHRLGAYRGVTHMGGLALQAEVCDWRRFGRAASLMGFVGLVPSEYSSGGSTHRGHLTKAGNAHVRAQLIEGAWQYQHRPYVGSVIAKRQEGVGPETVARAWVAQLRLCGRFRHLAARKNTKSV